MPTVLPALHPTVDNSIKAEFDAYTAIHPEASFSDFINAGFNAYRLVNPGALFSDFYRADTLARLDRGEIQSSIGVVTQSTQGVRVFAEGGEKVAKAYISNYDIRPEHRLLDYGCGSLRIGLHFINYLDPRKYLGMDIAPEFLEIGRKAIGAAEKRPSLLPITSESIESGKAFGARYVISHSVQYHVHPDEQETYFRNLATLASRRGSILIFNAKLYKTAIQFSRASWAWPMEHYLHHLKDLKFVKHTKFRSMPRYPEIMNGTFIFKRA